MIRKIIIPLLFCAAVASCKNDGPDSGNEHFFTAKETLGIYENDKNLFVYDKDLYQYAFNTQRKNFRIQNATQQRYVSCTLYSEPVVNQTVSVSVETKGVSTFPSQGLEVTVLKMSGGKIWLWNHEKNIGFIIRLE